MIKKKTIDDKKNNFFLPLYLDPALPLPTVRVGQINMNVKYLFCIVTYFHLCKFVHPVLHTVHSGLNKYAFEFEWT